MLEAKKQEVWRRSSHLPASAVWTCTLCVHLPPIKVKCSRFGEQPCPVCQRACQVPEEKALVMTLITTMALQLLVPATLAKDCFMQRKSVTPQGDNHLLTVFTYLHTIIYFLACLLRKRPCYRNIAMIGLLIRRNYERLLLVLGFQAFVSHFVILCFATNVPTNSPAQRWKTVQGSNQHHAFVHLNDKAPLLQ